MADKPHSKNAMLFVLITVMINSIGFGIMIPVLPDLLKLLTSLPNNEAVIYGMWLTFVFAFFQFICMPIVGGLSDRFGRRPVMLLSLLGLAIDYFIMGFAPTVAFLFIGRMIAGAFGATFSTANAYIADISPPETRAQNFGLVGASFGIGFMLGPVIGGLIGSEFGPRAPFIAAGIISLLNVVYGLIFLPETLAVEKRRPFSWKRSNPFGSIKSLGRIKGVKSLIFPLPSWNSAYGLSNNLYLLDPRRTGLDIRGCWSLARGIWNCQHDCSRWINPDYYSQNRVILGGYDWYRLGHYRLRNDGQCR